MANGWKMLALMVVGLIGIGAAILIADSRDSSLDKAGLPQAQSAVPAAPQPVPSAPVDDRFVIKRVLPIKGPIKYGEWHWNDAGVPDGPIVITVDLEARVLSIFRGGYEIGAAAVLLGSQEKPTPTGIFPITQKKRDHVSNLYDAPMPWMQRLTNDGISLHATTVEWGYASHGCIGMPDPFARKVFETTKLGDRVFITRGKMVQKGDSLVDS
jgi:lipoprotein-anchoring transpeptidase ErfK/SrfK